MTFEDLLELYKSKQKEFGKDAYKHISELLGEAKALHKKILKVMTMNNLGVLLKGKILKN